LSEVFADTGGFVALVDADDRNHRAARRFVRGLAKQGRSLVTSTYVVDEAITLIRLRVGHAAAVGFGERLLRTRWCRVVDIDEDLRRTAWDLFVRYDDQMFSFTDCTSFALMRSMSVSEAFAFDGDFGAAGFTRLPTA
jgi:predicted nucleic acid-binding protein